jgi:hypothetical protein
VSDASRAWARLGVTHLVIARSFIETLMHENPLNVRPPRRQPPGVVRRLLSVPITPEGTRIIDILAIFVGIPLAIVVCIPILIVTFVAAAGVGLLLGELGASDQVRGLVGILGLVGGLALCFLALLAIYRRLPAAMRGWIDSEVEEEPKEPTDPILDRVLTADPATFADRLASADAALAPDSAPSSDDDERRT